MDLFPSTRISAEELDLEGLTRFSNGWRQTVGHPNILPHRAGKEFGLTCSRVPFLQEMHEHSACMSDFLANLLSFHEKARVSDIDKRRKPEELVLMLLSAVYS